jgi:hypothetical protein
MKIAVHKEWEYMAHKECLDYADEICDDDDPKEFSIIEYEPADVLGRTCVLCHRELIYAAPECRPTFARIVGTAVGKEKVVK